jgi:hypothetical protein
MSGRLLLQTLPWLAGLLSLCTYSDLRCHKQLWQDFTLDLTDELRANLSVVELVAGCAE